jgi:hypothetical protein
MVNETATFVQPDLRRLEQEKVDQLQLLFDDDRPEPFGQHHVGSRSCHVHHYLYRMLLCLVPLEEDGPPPTELVQEPRVQEEDLQ